MSCPWRAPQQETPPHKPRFQHDTGFYEELKNRVDQHFETTGLRRRDSPRMYLKSAVILLWFGVSYASLVFAARTRWEAVTVFQMAHCSARATFPTLSETGDVPRSWAVHEVESTIDLARGSRILTWYLGGPNYHVEHHLVPKISHVHYPRLAPLVAAVCAELGVRYTVYDRFLPAVSSHWHWLQQMGRQQRTV